MAAKPCRRCWRPDNFEPIQQRLPLGANLAEQIVEGFVALERRVQFVPGVEGLGDGLDLLEQRHVVRIERGKMRRAGFGELHNFARKIFNTGGALRPMFAQNRFRAL